MNTKPLALVSILYVVTALSLSAGPYPVTIGPGLNFIANELNNALGNDLATILPSPPANCVLHKFNKATGAFDSEVFDVDSGGWSPGVMTLNPGEGAILDYSGSAPFVVTFAGVPPAPLAALVIGLCQPCLLSRRVPPFATMPSTYADIVGSPPPDGSMLAQFTGGPGYTTYLFLNGNWYQFSGGSWLPAAAPTVNVGESVWIIGAPPALTISTGAAAAPCIGNQKKLTWAPPAVLLSSPTLGSGAAWTPVAGATSPYFSAVLRRNSMIRF